MKKIINKLKPIFLLVGLSLTTFAIVSFTNFVLNQPQSCNSVSLNIEQVRGANDTVVPTSAETDTSLPSVIQEYEDSTGAVLSETVESPDGCLSKYNINSISKCLTQSTEDVDLEEKEDEEGNVVSANATIHLVYIPIPLELFSGMNVLDSNRLIEKEDPVFKSGGEQIDEETANNMLPPGTQIEEYKPWVEDDPFGLEYFLELQADGAHDTELGNIVIDKKIPNDCEDCNNSSNPTPEKSNNISDFMQDSLYRYPGQKEEIKEAGASDSIEACSPEDRFEVWDSNQFLACKMSLAELIKAWLESLKDLYLGNKNGVNPADIILIMSSPFGSNEDCPDGFCTNSYMDIRYSTAIAPDQEERGKFYYLTGCKALIQGELYDIPCAWDMTHLYKEKEFSSFDNIPTEEEIPTDDEYNDFFLNDVKGARDEVVYL